MKKIIYVLSLIIGTVAVTQAQVTYGFKAGGNLAKFTDNSDFEFKFGMHFGGVANIQLSDAFSLQPELLYSAQGYRQNFNGQKVRAKVDYFNIPILGSYQITEGLELQFGPQIGINIRKELEVDEQEGGSIFVNDIDASAAFGIKYFFDDYVFTQLRGTFGLTEVLTNSGYKNLVISLSLGVMLDSPIDEENYEEMD
ncbi:MAG: PorT family protein [Bacteroidia bacterium]|nr:PorT family protein [Bacteroidia bacterium]NND24848.1 PorT family protein [Flavobacteriaceae bacterium]RZW44767.1 MAG: PorT family protein [Flavobacteriaceae bacterium]